jgi:uncharacterized protein YjiS (DUF1127 family)
MTSATLFPDRARHRPDLADFGRPALRSDGDAPPAARPRRAGLWTRVLALLALWVRRESGRRQLLAMSELQRRDIGITRLDVCREVDKPFWRL